MLCSAAAFVRLEAALALNPDFQAPQRLLVDRVISG